MIVTMPSGVMRMKAFGANSAAPVRPRSPRTLPRLEQLDVAGEQHAAAGDGGDAKE